MNKSLMALTAVAASAVGYLAYRRSQAAPAVSKVVENAADDLRAEIFLVVDPLDKNTADLIEWAREHRFKIAGISATRVTGISQYARIIDGILRRSYEQVVVADLYYESSDPRVTVHRRVTW